MARTPSMRKQCLLAALLFLLSPMLAHADPPPSMTALLERPEKYLQPLFDSEPPAATSPVHAYFEYYGMGLPDVDHRFGSFTSGPYRLAAHVFRPEEPQGTVVVLHGYYDHVGITKNLIRFFVAKQLAVAAYDMPGHGLSTGARVSIDSFQEYVTALEDFLRLCQRHLPGPFHLVGHSTGGAAALDHLLTAEETPFEKVILLAPLVRSYAWELSKVGNVAAGRWVESVPRVFRTNSSDEAFVQFLREDPLQDDHFPLRWANALYAWDEKIKAYPPSKRRVLVIQGTADTTVDWKYNVEFIQEKLPAAKIVLLEKARHQLFNESHDLRGRLLGEIAAYLADSEP